MIIDHSINTGSQETVDISTSLNESIANQASNALGNVAQRTDIRSSLAPFQYLPGYQIAYPASVSEALSELYVEYNHAFQVLMGANAEFETDYQHCKNEEDLPINHIVQIDMVGLPDTFLQSMIHGNRRAIKDALRGRIFEIENSVAMYSFLSRVFSQKEKESEFSKRFRSALQTLRERFRKPIALLAISEEKYKAMRAIEFGKTDETPLSDNDVYQQSGFDALFGPEEFRKHVESNDGESDYLLYVRSSNPVSMLKNPREVVKNPLLQDPSIRRIIRANTLTFNIDNPDGTYNSKINDTKEYLSQLGMGYAINSLSDILPDKLIEHLRRGGGFQEFKDRRYTHGLESYLYTQGIDPQNDPVLRGKPMKGAYGCYGHVRGKLSEGEFRAKIRRNLESRGSYIIQPEQAVPIITNTTDGITYQFIDRNFLGYIGNRPHFLGGFRTLLPVTTEEAKNGRNHGSREAVFAEIHDSPSPHEA